MSSLDTQTPATPDALRPRAAVASRPTLKSTLIKALLVTKTIDAGTGTGGNSAGNGNGNGKGTGQGGGKAGNGSGNGPRIPIWLRRRASRKPPRIPTTPSQASWWIGVVWLALSALLLGFVGHVTLFGALQHHQSQKSGYEDLRTSLAQAVTPLGQLDVDEKLVEPGTPLALLTIPKITLTEVVREGTASDQTRQGVGHRRDTVMPGQEGTSVLFGRQAGYGGPFGGLSTLAPGDAITVTTGQGVKEFTVIGLRRAGDILPPAVRSGNGRLELVTADGPALAPFGVLYVDAELKGKAASTPARVFTTQALSPAEEVMGSDSSTGLALLFSLQWLLVAAGFARWLTRVWGRWQTWIIMSPVLLILGATAADAASALLPNLM